MDVAVNKTFRHKVKKYIVRVTNVKGKDYFNNTIKDYRGYVEFAFVKPFRGGSDTFLDNFIKNYEPYTLPPSQTIYDKLEEILEQ